MKSFLAMKIKLSLLFFASSSRLCLRLPLHLNKQPKNLYSVTFCITSPLKSMKWLTWLVFCRTTIVFVFLTFQVSCQLSQNILSLLTLFWSPSLLSGIIRRSSANAREPTLEFKSFEGLHSSVLKLALRSFMKILKRVELIESLVSHF